MDKKSQQQIIENLSFYTFGRTEREIEYLAERLGISKAIFTDRLSTLFSGASMRDSMGLLDRVPVPTLQSDAAPGVHRSPTLALANGSPNNEPSQVSKKTRVLELLPTLVSPMNIREFFTTIQEQTGVPRANLYPIIHSLKKQKLVRLRGKTFSWETNGDALAAPPVFGNNGRTVRIATNSNGGLKVSIIILRSLARRSGPIGRGDLTAHLRQKYPEVKPHAWNGAINSLVRHSKVILKGTQLALPH